MSLPRAIQQQVEAADSLVAQINGQTGGDPPETAENPANNPAISQPADPPQPISQETEPKPAPVPEETWERKYLTLKGMYDAEVPRLHAQLREVNTQVQTLIAENAAAKARTPEPAPAPAQTLITEQDREAFGPDLLDLIERATEQKLAGYRQQETQIKAAKVQGDLQIAQQKLVMDAQKAQADQELAGLKVGAQIKDSQAKLAAQQEQEGVRMGIDIAKSHHEARRQKEKPTK